MAFTFIAACSWHSATSGQEVLRGPDGRRAWASRLGHRQLPDRGGLLSFQSLIDVHIEGILRAKPGQDYWVVDASNLGHEKFLTKDRSFVAVQHLAWPTLEGRLLLNPNGSPCGCVEVASTSADAGLTYFKSELSAVARSNLDRLHESAGLFAWHETSDATLTWCWERVREVAERAVRSARAITRSEGLSIDDLELGLFNPESEQWHFVPNALVDRVGPKTWLMS